MDGIPRKVQPDLNIIEELVQPFVDDLANLNVVQFPAKPAEMLLGCITKRSKRCAGNRMERPFGRNETAMDRPGELAVQNKKLHDSIRGYLLITLPVHFECTGGSEHSAPHDVIVRTSDCIDGRQQKVILRIKNARRFVRALDEPAKTAEMPPLVMRHGCVQGS